MEIAKFLVEHGNTLGAVTILLLGIAALGIALLKEPEALVTGSRYREKDTLCKTLTAALEIARTELRSTENLMIRLQVEKELGWKKPEITVNRRAKR